MELIINQSRVKKGKYQIAFFMTLISFLFSLVSINGTSLLFVLPFFYLCFMCGYAALLSYTIGTVLAVVLLQVPYEILIISAITFVILEICIVFQSMKSRYVPYILTLIAGVYYASIQIDLLSTLLLTVLTYLNTIIFSYLMR